MPRHFPDPPNWGEPQKREEIKLQLKVVTPMFGGGYKAREVDPICVIRPAAIRGHLRFWWRATAGAAYSSPKLLFEAEEKIWGSVEKPGKVIVKADLIEPGQSIRCASYERDRRDPSKYRSFPTFQPNWPPYALQAFQGELANGRRTIRDDCALARLDTVFSLHITFLGVPRNEVEASIRAWILYGGIGARTRRGCGSLSCIDASVQQVTFPPAQTADGLTILRGSRYVLGQACDSPITAWEKAVKVYWEFRQKPGFAREPVSGTPPTPGRSRWPEPDSIRRIAGNASSGHEPSHPDERSFPRADLGLPIIFHFKDYDDRRAPGQANDPADTTLEGPSIGMRRFASPVITKAAHVGNNNFRPLVMVLNAPHVWQYGSLKLSGGANAIISKTEIELTPAQRAQVHPLHCCGDQPIREALLQYVVDRWNSKVEGVS